MALTAAHGLHRFGMGAAPREAAGLAPDPTAWLARQAEVRPRPSSPDRLIAATKSFRAAMRAPNKAARQTALRGHFRTVRATARRQVGQDFLAAAESQTPFLERLVWFWTNHFTVSAKGKSRVLPFVASYQADAIRPHALGKFEDMLIAAEQHPAMQIYLDNALSVGPNSAAGKRRDRDLNENLAREILELHTVGVGGGYGQRDVIELARLLTGWTIPLGPKAPMDAPPFVFSRRRHEPGDKRIMGVGYGEGRQEGERALRDLARRPETAQFLSGKLCRHFLADRPPAAALNHVAGRFLATGGDLRQTSLALIEAAALPGALDGAKFRAPADHLAAAVRALGPSLAPPEAAVQTLIRWGQAPYLAGSPAGFSDLAEDLAQPDAILRRIEWASEAAGRQTIEVNPLDLAHDVFGDRLSDATAEALSGAESPADALALLLVSPEFMWR